LVHEGSRVAGKVAVVTGAAEGIGEACARTLAAQGATVFVTDINAARGEHVAGEIGGGSTFTALDVTDLAAWEALIALVTEAHGGLDILVNNAGGAHAIGSIQKQTPASHAMTLDINVTGTWNGIRSAIPAMAAKGGGSVVNISSIDGLVGIRNLSSYVAAKHAVLGLTRSLALELGDKGIRVNSVHPGITATPTVLGTTPESLARLQEPIARQPIPRMGRPEEVAMAVLFFASGESSYCTGTSLVVDGGQLAGMYREALD
jgi:Dehydrogenases with different specificities (related to short-chain alcohol dehydrogenases)